MSNSTKKEKKMAKKEYDVSEKIECCDCNKKRQKGNMRYLGTHGDKEVFRCLTCVHARLEDSKLEGKLCCRCADVLVSGVPTYVVAGFHSDICERCYTDIKKVNKLPVGTKAENKTLYERFLLLESRSCGPCHSAHAWDFQTQEQVLRMIQTHRILDAKVIRVSSSGPIEIEDCCVGYDVNITKKVKR